MGINTYYIYIERTMSFLACTASTPCGIVVVTEVGFPDVIAQIYEAITPLWPTETHKKIYRNTFSKSIYSLCTF